VSVLVSQDRPINGSIDSPLEPQPAPSFDHDQLIRVRIQTRWRATTTATTTAKAKTLIRKKIDISDLLIQKIDISDLLIQKIDISDLLIQTPIASVSFFSTRLHLRVSKESRHPPPFLTLALLKVADLRRAAVEV
jgi:hypothetical protein